MTTVLLVRHGLTALTGTVLAGWTPGVDLDDHGRAQARALGARLAPVPLDLIITSPLDRCRQTAAVIAASRDGRPAAAVEIDERVGECRYGDWTGKQLKRLVKEPLWRVVQVHPSAVRFPGPGGEAVPQMQHRAVSAIRDWNAKLGPDATYLVCSHADVIKAIVADSMGIHLDLFQRIQIDPCSLTVIRYTELRPFLQRLNDTGGDVADLIPAVGENQADCRPGEADGRKAGKQRVKHKDRGPARRARDSDAAVGGGAGAVRTPASAASGADDAEDARTPGIAPILAPDDGRVVRQQSAQAQG